MTVVFANLCFALWATSMAASPPPAKTLAKPTHQPRPAPATTGSDGSATGTIDAERPTELEVDLRVAEDPSQKKLERIKARIRALRAWKLSEELDLDEITAARLFPILNRYDEKFEALRKEKRQLQRRMQALIDSGANDAKTIAELNRLIDRRVAKQQKKWDLQQARFRDTRAVLTPRQSAKIFVLLPAIDRNIKRQLQRAIHGKKKRRRPAEKRLPRRDRRGGADHELRRYPHRR